MKAKKVGILTIFNCNNYGAVLQAYALHWKVKDLGYDCEILDIYPPEHPLGKLPQRFKAPSSAKKRKSTRNRINTSISKLINLYGQVINRNQLEVKNQRFATFKEKHISISEGKFLSVDDLYSYTHPYDVLITGSDQVWNPLSPICSPEPYFLTFATNSQKKISYAPSFGVSKLPMDIHEDYKKWLNGIDCLSIREKQGADIIDKLTGRKAEIVLDPTFLLETEDWDKVAAKPAIEKPYILIYALTHAPYITKLAYELKKKTGYSIVKIPRGNMREGFDIGIKNLFETGPAEFLGLFKNASFVLTTSFHGTAFAINYQKPFYSILRKKGQLNSRILSLLGKLGLDSRLRFDDNEISEINDIGVDFSDANSLLNKEREKSFYYLTKALEK